MVDFNRFLNRPSEPPDPVPDIIVAVTGHRPDKLPNSATGYVWDNPAHPFQMERR